MLLAIDIGSLASPLLLILGVDLAGARGGRPTGSVRLVFDPYSRVL